MKRSWLKHCCSQPFICHLICRLQIFPNTRFLVAIVTSESPFVIKRSAISLGSISISRSRWTWQVIREDKRSCPMVERSHVFSLRRAEKDLSALQELAGDWSRRRNSCSTCVNIMRTSGTKLWKRMRHSSKLENLLLNCEWKNMSSCCRPLFNSDQHI